jgi:hypothetical protein
MAASSADAMRSMAMRYGPRKGPVVDSTVACRRTATAAGPPPGEPRLRHLLLLVRGHGGCQRPRLLLCLTGADDAVRALVDDHQRLADPLLLVGLHERLRHRHESCGVAGLLDGELLRPAHGVGHLGVLGKRARASSLSMAHLLLPVGAIASGGREGFGGGGGKRVFGAHGALRLDL